jgi:hypothetical protein
LPVEHGAVKEHVGARGRHAQVLALGVVRFVQYLIHLLSAAGHVGGPSTCTPSTIEPLMGVMSAYLGYFSMSLCTLPRSER